MKIFQWSLLQLETEFLNSLLAKLLKGLFLANDPESIIMITSTTAYMSAGRSHLLQAGGESRPRAAGLDPRGGDIQAPLIIIIIIILIT